MTTRAAEDSDTIRSDPVYTDFNATAAPAPAAWGGDRSIASEDSRRPCEDASRRLVLFHRTAAPMADRNVCKCGARPRRACAGAAAPGYGDLEPATS